jgi:hypothetical protein
MVMKQGSTSGHYFDIYDAVVVQRTGKGALAEWLRRGPAKAVCYACVSSNLTGVECYFSLWEREIFKLTKSVDDEGIEPTT